MRLSSTGAVNSKRSSLAKLGGLQSTECTARVWAEWWRWRTSPVTPSMSLCCHYGPDVQCVGFAIGLRGRSLSAMIHNSFATPVEHIDCHLTDSSMSVQSLMSSCSICGHRFDSKSCPQLLPCCHSSAKDCERDDRNANQLNHFINTNSEFQIRHSKSDPVIHTSTKSCKLYIERSDFEANSDLSTEIDTTLLYPHWFSSSSSLSSMDSTISAEDLIHEMVTIEGLRTLYNSCFACGVSWHQNHVTLDCSECGGYAMSRPCPQCDGKCDSQWQRNLTATHDAHVAQWTGQCKQEMMQTSTDLRDSSNKSSSPHSKLITSVKV
ncbi:unnamed protein product [Oppiella nova]|uniref:Uncharacterized protein n=1 Tax=Oppiella nova TaxID=334625 RepID=A0A7R9QS67_9ACAR|nr:unnamed protein product [Oppiella nova]CAG2172390.1 unnamed protein product [Oppiella nova]